MYRTKDEFVKQLSNLTDLEKENLREALIELEIINEHEIKYALTTFEQVRGNLKYLKKDISASIDELLDTTNDMIKDLRHRNDEP